MLEGNFDPIKKRGRPKIARSERKTAREMHLYLSEEDHRRLEYIIKKEQISKQDVLRKGLELVYSLSSTTNKRVF